MNEKLTVANIEKELDAIILRKPAGDVTVIEKNRIATISWPVRISCGRLYYLCNLYSTSNQGFRSYIIDRVISAIADKTWDVNKSSFLDRACEFINPSFQAEFMIGIGKGIFRSQQNKPLVKAWMEGLSRRNLTDSIINTKENDQYIFSLPLSFYITEEKYFPVLSEENLVHLLKFYIATIGTIETISERSESPLNPRYILQLPEQTIIEVMNTKEIKISFLKKVWYELPRNKNNQYNAIILGMLYSLPFNSLREVLVDKLIPEYLYKEFPASWSRYLHPIIRYRQEINDSTLVVYKMKYRSGKRWNSTMLLYLNSSDEDREKMIKDIFSEITIYLYN